MDSMPDDGVRYGTDIRPLFRDTDIRSMRFAFDLGSYDDVRDKAEPILERLRAGDMPCDSAWPSTQIDLFERWIRSGMAR
jgi:hypothetical protein